MFVRQSPGRWARTLFSLASTQRRETLRRNHRLATASEVESLEDRVVPAVFNALPSAIAPDQAVNTDGKLSLREAIIAANKNGANDTINLKTGTYTLSVANSGGQENAALEGDLDISNDPTMNARTHAVTSHTLTIVGKGAGVTFIDAAGIDRVFQIAPGSTVVFRNLTIKGGLATDDGTSSASGTGAAHGGGILMDGAKVTLDNVQLTGNNAKGTDGTDESNNPDTRGGAGHDAAGGGVYASSNTANVLTLINNSTLRNNKAVAGAGGHGGNASSDSSSTAGRGGDGGNAQGGGLYIGGGTITLTSANLQSNSAIGGNGGTGGTGNNTTSGADGGQAGDAQGGGLYASGAAVTLTASNLTLNQANGGRGGDAGGNASSGTAGGNGGDGGLAQGGGLFATGGSLTVATSNVRSNQAIGGNAGDGKTGDDVSKEGSSDAYGGQGGAAQGAGLYLSVASPSITTSTIANNSATGGNGGQGGDGTRSGSGEAVGGDGGNGGDADGAGVYSASGSLSLTVSTLSGNSLQGGRGGDGGHGGVATGGVRGRGVEGGFGGDGGSAHGAGLFVGAGSVTVVANSTIARNTALGGNGGNGGAGGSAEADFNGGAGGRGGYAYGGGVFAEQSVFIPGVNGDPDITKTTKLTLSNATVSNNSVRGGNGGNGGNIGTDTGSSSSGFGGNGGDSGEAAGGGVFAGQFVPNSENEFNSVTIRSSTIVENAALSSTGGDAGLQGESDGTNVSTSGGGVSGGEGQVDAISSIFALNSAGDAPDIFGSIGVAEHNLIGDNNGMGLADTGFNGDTPVPDENGNIVGTSIHGGTVIDPLLTPLQNNGGPTETHAPLAGSPVIDTGSNPNNVLVDQRGTGFVRQMGAGVDIGAVEVQLPSGAQLLADPQHPGKYVLVVTGTNGKDNIEVESEAHHVPADLQGQSYIQVFFNGETGPNSQLFSFLTEDVGRIMIYGLDGNDTIEVEDNVSIDTILDGGAGNDTLLGGSGNDVLLGQAGDDNLSGRKGRDILVGGAGKDKLDGGDGEDILFGGSTNYDNDQSVLCQLISAWETGLADAIGHTTSVEPVLVDDAKDTLTGGAGNDLFLRFNNPAATKDVITDATAHKDVIVDPSTIP